MKKVILMLIPWVIVFGFIALFIFQNQTFFLAKNAFHLNLGIREFLIPEINNAVLVLVFFGTAIIIAYLLNFWARFKANRTIKKLKRALQGAGISADALSDSVKLNMTASRKTAADESVGFDSDQVDSNPFDDNDTGESVIEVKY